MSSRSCSRVVLGAVATLGLSFVSCSESPSRPSPIPSSPASAIVRLDLVAPQEMALGESVQLTAQAVRSDGRVENVTTQTQWMVQSSSTGTVLSLRTPGLVTGIDVGRGSLRLNSEVSRWMRR